MPLISIYFGHKYRTIETIANNVLWPTLAYSIWYASTLTTVLICLFKTKKHSLSTSARNLYHIYRAFYINRDITSSYRIERGERILFQIKHDLRTLIFFSCITMNEGLTMKSQSNLKWRYPRKSTHQYLPGHFIDKFVLTWMSVHTW